jgi:hypothetical protein
MSLSGRWSFWPEKEHSVTSDPLDPEFVHGHGDVTGGYADVVVGR